MFSRNKPVKPIKEFSTMSTAQCERAFAVASELQEKLFPNEGGKNPPSNEDYKSYVFTGKLLSQSRLPVEHTFLCRLGYLGLEGKSVETLYEISAEWGDVVVSREFIAGDSIDRLVSVLLGKLRKEGYVSSVA